MKHDPLCPCDDPQPIKHSHGTATYVQGWVTCRCELIKQAREQAIKDCIAVTMEFIEGDDGVHPAATVPVVQVVTALSSLLEGEEE